MSEAVESAEIKKIDVLFVSASSQFDRRVHSLADAFGYTFQKELTADNASNNIGSAIVQFIVFDAGSVANPKEIDGNLQVLKFHFPKAPMLVVFPKQFDEETMAWLRKSGADFLMNESDFLELGLFDFFITQSIGSHYLPVKKGEIEVNTRIEIPLYHFMPANRKYFRLIPENSLIDEKRIEKIQKIGEVYIRRADVDVFNEYLSQHADKSKNGALHGGRKRFMEFRQKFLKLVNKMTEVANSNVSFDEGKAMLEEGQRLSAELISEVSQIDDVFDLISQSIEGDFNSVDRAPERAAIVAFFSQRAKIGDTKMAVLASLLGDVGMLRLPSTLLHQIRQAGVESLGEAQRKLFEQHPQISINIAAEKKIQLDPVVRAAILYSHANLNETGFPITRADKIGLETQLVHFVQILDDHCQIRLGKTRRTYRDELKRYLYDMSTMTIISPVIVKALKELL